LPRRRSRRRRVRERPWFKWFVAGGILGILVAFFVFYALSHELVIAEYAIIFWPTSMIMLSANDGFWNETLTIAFAFIGNFLIYGLLGVLIGMVVKHSRRLSAPRDSN